MFADDTSIFLKGENVNVLERTLNEELMRLSDWLQANKLSVNVSKTHCMVFSNSAQIANRDNRIYVNDVLIDTVHTTNFLGVIIDQKITWRYHIDKVCCKMSKGIGIIKKLRRVLSRKSLLNLYYTFIYPYLIHCIVI